MRSHSKVHLQGRSHSSGVAAFELVCVLPMLITLVFGCVDFGRFGYTYIAVTNGARAGADFASTNRYTTANASNWTAKVRQAVEDEMSQMPGFDSANLTVASPAPTQDGIFRLVTVQATYDFRTIVTWPALPNRVALSRTVGMRVIRG